MAVEIKRKISLRKIPLSLARPLFDIFSARTVRCVMAQDAFTVASGGNRTGTTVSAGGLVQSRQRKGWWW